MRRTGSAFVGLAAFVAYASLAPPVSGGGDGSEFTLVLATWGVAHPTGYPLYTLFGHLFVTLAHALGAPWPLAANLWSAAGAAVAIGLLHALAAELVDPAASANVRFLSALVPVTLFAFQPVFLPEAMTAEVNGWGLAWACAAGFAFVRLVRAIPASGGPGALRTGAAVWGALCGAGLAHHLTSVLVSVPLSLALAVALARGKQLKAPLLAIAAGAALVPLSSYGIIAWRAWHPAAIQWSALGPGLSSVVAHVTGDQYRHFVGYFAPAPEQRELLARAAYPFLIPGFALLVLGAARARDLERRFVWIPLTAAAALVTAFTFRYGVPDPAPYFLPAMALGVAAAGPALAALGRSRSGAAWLVMSGLVALVLIVPWIREGVATRRGLLSFEKIIRSMWSAVPPDSAIVFWPDDRFFRLVEYQKLRGEKPALLVVCPDMLFDDRTMAKVRARVGFDPLAGRPIPHTRPGDPDEDRIIVGFFREVIHDMNERSVSPVIIFDPSVPIVQRLRKPWEPVPPPAPALVPHPARAAVRPPGASPAP